MFKKADQQGRRLQKSGSRRAQLNYGIPQGATLVLQAERTRKYVSKAKGRPACAKPLRRRQGTRAVAIAALARRRPLAGFFNIPYM